MWFFATKNLDFLGKKTEIDLLYCHANCFSVHIHLSYSYFTSPSNKYWNRPSYCQCKQKLNRQHFFSTFSSVTHTRTFFCTFWQYLQCKKFEVINQKGMAFDHDFCNFILLFFFPLFEEERKKGEKNNPSRGEKSCLSARSYEILQNDSSSVWPWNIFRLSNIFFII